MQSIYVNEHLKNVFGQFNAVTATQDRARLNLETEDAIRKAATLRDNPSLISLTAAEKWDGQLPNTMVPGSAMPFIGVK